MTFLIAHDYYTFTFIDLKKYNQEKKNGWFLQYIRILLFFKFTLYNFIIFVD